MKWVNAFLPNVRFDFMCPKGIKRELDQRHSELYFNSESHTKNMIMIIKSYDYFFLSIPCSIEELNLFMKEGLGSHAKIKTSANVIKTLHCNQNKCLKVRANRTTNKAEMLDENIGRFAPGGLIYFSFFFIFLFDRHPEYGISIRLL